MSQSAAISFSVVWAFRCSLPSVSYTHLDVYKRQGQSVTKEILDFDHLHPTEARARLIDRHGKILDVKSMGFDNNEDVYKRQKR